MDTIRRFSQRLRSRNSATPSQAEIPSQPLPPAPTGPTPSGRQASSQPKHRKLQKKPPGTSKPKPQVPIMKPIGEYPSAAEYRGAGVTPPSTQRVATVPDARETERELDSGAETPTVDKSPAEDIAEEADIPVTVEVPTPANDFGPAFSPPDPSTNNSDFISVLDSLPLPTSEKYNMPKLKYIVKLAINHAIEGGHAKSALALLYFWSNSIEDEFRLSLIANLGGVEVANDELRLALLSIINHSYGEARKWYQNYVDTGAARLPDMPSGDEDSSLSSVKSAEQGPAFKISDMYRDTSGARPEELFASGKTNTAPLKRPKKPCPVNEKSFRRKRGWEGDPELEENIRSKRREYDGHTIHDNAPVVQFSDCREELGPPDAIEHPYTFDHTTEINRSRSLPVPAGGGSILDLALHGEKTKAPSIVSAGDSLLIKRQKGSRRQSLKKQLPIEPQRARSLSVDTTVSSLSSLSNSVYSVRFNDWAADHEPRCMPNSIEPPENSDNCHHCGKGGELLCCDTCDNAFHFNCLDPPLDPKNPPQGEWHCPKCSIRNSFSTLIAHSKHFKKTEFQVPQHIKDTFEGVQEGVVFDRDYARNPKHQRYYKPAPHLPRLTKAPKQDGPTIYANPQLLRETDAKGDLIRCSKCSFTSGGRPIITCDYCPCRFHLDCLDPPRAHPPNPKVGWMCPNHVTPEDMIATKEVDGIQHFRRVRRTKNMKFIDCDIRLPDDPNQSIFDDDWKERRARFYAGDVVLNFISSVKDDHFERQTKYANNVEQKCLDLTKKITEEYLARHGTTGPSDTQSRATLPTDLQQKISASVRGMISGAPVSTADFDAASALLGLSRADLPAPAESHMTEPPSSKAGSRVDEGIAVESSHVTSPPPLNAPKSPNAPSHASQQSEYADSDILPRIPVFTTAMFHRNKRSRADDKEQDEVEEPAQKRLHTSDTE